MDGEGRTYYGERFEGVKQYPCGNVGAMFSNPKKRGKKLLPSSEECLVEMSSKRMRLLDSWPVPEDIAQRLLFEIQMNEIARKAIQDYKLKHDIPLDTPRVSLKEIQDTNYDAAANDPVFSL